MYGGVKGKEKPVVYPAKEHVSQVTKKIKARLEKFQRKSPSAEVFGGRKNIFFPPKERSGTFPLEIIEEFKEGKVVMKDDIVIPQIIIEEGKGDNTDGNAGNTGNINIIQKETLASANWKRAVGAVTLDLSEKELNEEKDQGEFIRKRSLLLVNTFQHVVRSAIAGHMQIQAFKPTAETTPPINYEVSKAEQLLRKSLLNAVRYNTMNFTHTNTPAKEFKDYDFDEDGMEKFESGNDEKEDDNRSKEKHEHDKFRLDDDEDEGSVSSTSSGGTSTFMKSYYGIRAAVDDNYTPQFIKKSQWISFIVFIIFITISGILYFILS